MDRKRTDSSKDALQLLEFASSLDPYALSASPETNCEEIASAWEHAGLQPDRRLGTTIKLWQGMSDTAKIIHNALNDHDTPPLPEDDAIAIALHATTVDTITYAAQLGEESLRNTNWQQFAHNRYIRTYDPTKYYQPCLHHDPRLSRRFILNDTLSAIIQNPDFDEQGEHRDPSSGCPFAHGEIKRSKVFDRFVRWAGILAVRDYYAIKKDTF